MGLLRSGKWMLLIASLAALAAGAALIPWRPVAPDRVEAPSSAPRIEGLISEGRTYLALKEAEQLLVAEPQDLRLAAACGRLRFMVGDYPAGEELLRALVARDPRPAHSWLALARLEAEASRYREAEQAAREALKVDPQVPGARAIIARWLLNANQYEEARDLLAARVKDGTADREEFLVHGQALVRLGQHREAVEVLTRGLAIPAIPPETGFTPTDPDDPYATLAEALIGSGEHRRAADHMAEKLEADPTTVRHYYLLGTALARLGRREAAREVFKAYEALSKFDGRWSKTREMDRAGARNRAAYERAAIHAETSQYRQALAACRRAASLTVANRIDDAPVLLATARLLLEIEAPVEASEIIDRAVSSGLEPATEFLSTRGAHFLRAGKLAEARAAFDRAIAASAGNLEALIGRGRVALEGGEPPGEAEGFFERARAQAPALREPIFWLARAAVERGEAVKSREYLRAALGLEEGASPGADMLSCMGLSALRGGAKEEAARLFLDAVKLTPLSVDALRGLEESFVALGDRERAAKAAEIHRRAEAIRTQLRELRASPARFEERGDAFLALAEACRSANQAREARRFFHLAREAAPLNPAAQRALAEVLEAPEERFFKAQALASVLRLRPDDGGARRGLALTLARIGARLDRALELAGGTPAPVEAAESSYVLGEVLLARDDLEGAAREAEAARAANPGEKRFQDLVQRVQARKAGKP